MKQNFLLKINTFRLFYKGHSILTLWGLLLTLMILLLYILFVFFKVTNNKIIISFVNVGQGDATLISLYNNINILCDTGKENFGIENIEKSLDKNLLTKETINTLIISHSDADHSSKAEYFLNKYNIKDILLNNKLYFDRDYAVQATNIIAGQYIKYYNYNNTSTSTLFFINPLHNEFYTDENEGSVATILNHGNFNFIIMADVGKEYEKRLLYEGYFDKVIKNKTKLRDVTDLCESCVNILRVGHHGSKTSSDESFIKAIAPDYCIISLGKNNYGHPDQEVLKTLSKYCKKIYQTDIHGTIDFEIANDNLKIKYNK